MWSNEPTILIQYKMRKKSNTVPQADDKYCQSTKYYENMCSDKKCPENINIQLVNSQVDVQLPKPAVQYVYSRLCKDKNSQSTRCYKKRNYDKYCQ